MLEASWRLIKNKVNFKSIESHSKNTWKITFETMAQANAVIRNKAVKDSGFIAIIPRFKLQRKGVIKGIPVDITNEELLESLRAENPEVAINRIFRLKRRDYNSKQWINSQSVCVEFKGQTLPRDVKLWRAVLEVSIYVPQVRRCYNCGGIGHISKGCTSQPKCLQCGESHPIDKTRRCENPKRCINCGKDHFTLDRTCTKFIQQVEIIRIMAYDNVSYIEARRRIVREEDYQHRRNITKDDRNFPSLGEEPGINRNQTRSRWEKSTGQLFRSPETKSAKIRESTSKSSISGEIDQLLNLIFQAENQELLIKRILNTIKLHCGTSKTISTQKTNEST